MNRKDFPQKKNREVDTLSSNKNKFYTLTKETVRKDLVITHSSHWWYRNKENCRAGNPFKGYLVTFHWIRKGDAINKASDQYRCILILPKKVWVTFSCLNGLVEIGVNSFQTKWKSKSDRRIYRDLGLSRTETIVLCVAQKTNMAKTNVLCDFGNCSD